MPDLVQPDQRIQILISGLEERYAASHHMRERSLRFSIWLSGMAFGLAWLLVCGQTFTLAQKTALTTLIGAMAVGAFFFLWSLEKGFQNNRRVMVKFEKALGLHRPGFYLEDELMLPQGYKDTSRRWNGHFSTLCVWLAVVMVSLLVLTWAGPENGRALPEGQKTEQKLVDGGKQNG